MPAYMTKIPEASMPVHIIISKMANGKVGVLAKQQGVLLASASCSVWLPTSLIMEGLRVISLYLALSLSDYTAVI